MLNTREQKEGRSWGHAGRDGSGTVKVGNEGDNQRRKKEESEKATHERAGAVQCLVRALKGSVQSDEH